jgi:hypothetical protein
MPLESFLCILVSISVPKDYKLFKGQIKAVEGYMQNNLKIYKNVQKRLSKLVKSGAKSATTRFSTPFKPSNIKASEVLR